MEDKRRREAETLVDMRTHLTVTTLAVAQLRRRHGDSPDIARLCSYAESAITRLNEDIATMEAALSPMEGRNDSWQGPARLRPSPPGDMDSLGTGPMALPSRIPQADVHDQETAAIHLPVNPLHNRSS